VRARTLLASAFVAAGVLRSVALGAEIVADHTVVDKYSIIPQSYIDQVKTMWAVVPGESHSSGVRIGLALLQAAEAKYAVNIRESGTPDPPSTTALRFSRATWGNVGSATGWRYGYGEEDWYTSQTAIDRTKAGITYCNTHSLPLTATGFGWCWDMTWHNSPGGTEDPVHRVRWAGSSVGGPDDDLRWGLDTADETLTGNHINLDTYLQATQAYVDHCIANGYSTKVLFTTGPAEGGGESGYQRHLKNQRIRDYVHAGQDLILFDYADILAWSNSGVGQTTSWTDLGGTARTFEIIHSDNRLNLDGSSTEDGDHIGQRGAIRLAKAMWWLLARIAGWDGNASTDASRFYPLTPCRAFDTRVESGSGAGAPVFDDGERRVWTLAGLCSVPADAKAASLNVTVVSAEAEGDLRLTGGHLPSTVTSAVSIPISRARANNAIVQLSTSGDGAIAVTNASSGTVHVVIDINGYFR
jgi:hypothetical protein